MYVGSELESSTYVSLGLGAFALARATVAQSAAIHAAAFRAERASAIRLFTIPIGNGSLRGSSAMGCRLLEAIR
jgi:hypothetical protein